MLISVTKLLSASDLLWRFGHQIESENHKNDCLGYVMIKLTITKSKMTFFFLLMFQDLKNEKPPNHKSPNEEPH